MTAVSPDTQQPVARPRRLTFLPWMDGMRAIAVIAVMVFHEAISQPQLRIQRWSAGGDLGVDVFFAISGFLITTLLLQEARERGSIRFGAFYIRRARRLLPALFVLLAALAVASLFDDAHHRRELLTRIVETLFYVGNLVAARSSQFRGMLNHTWSLSTEEQFYLLWPAILAVLILLARRWRPALLVGLTGFAAVAFLWPQVAASRHWGFSRMYYAPDTRVAPIALGAVLAGLWTSGLLPTSRLWVVIRRLAAAAGVVFIALSFHNEKFIDHLTQFGMNKMRVEYQNFSLIGLATVFILWELLESTPHLGHRILSLPPLVAIGRISYGLYLWDAVIVLALNPAFTGVYGWPTLYIHIVTIFAIATLSWFLVERHFVARRGAARRPVLPVPPEAAPA